MLDVTVKTLDGKNRSFSVPDDILVRDFKLKIASSVEITADTQRLIFQGRVLQDDKKLNDYDVNGKTLHIVQRPPPLAPPTAGSAGRSTPAPPPSTTTFNGGRRTMSGQVSTSANVVVGSVGIPHDAIDPAQIQNAVQQALTASGIVGPGQNVLVQTRGDGSSVDVRINLGPAMIESESQNRLNMVRRMMDGAIRILNRLENPDAAATNTAPMDTSPTGPSTGNPQAGSPMDTSASPPPDGRAADASPPPGSSTDGPSTTPPGGSAAPDGRPGVNAGAGTGVGAQSRPVHPAPPALAELLSVVFDVNRRLQPFLENYRDILQRDPAFTAEESEEMRVRQVEVDRVAEVMHYISHAYHAITDIMVNLAQPPPRQLRAGSVTLPSGAFMHHIAPQAHAHLNVIRPNPIPASSVESDSTAVPRSSTSDTPSNVSNSAVSSSGVESMTQTNGSRPTPATGGPPPPPPPPPPAPPMGMPTNGQPYVFMEVGPQSVSISSVTSHVVTDAPTPPTMTQNAPPTTTSNVPTSAQANTQPTNTTQSNQAGQPHARTMPRLPNLSGIMGGMPSFMPPDLLQNIIHMATNAAARTHAGQAGHHVIIVTQEGDTSPTETLSASTNTSTSVTSSSSSASTSTRPSGGAETATPSTSSTAAPSASTTAAGTTGTNGREPHRATLLFPGPPGGHGMFRPPGAELVEPVDPYLPCQSRFFLGRRQPEGAHPPAQDGVGGMVTNLLSSVFSQHQHAHAHAMSHQHQQQHQQSAAQGTQAGRVPPPPQATNPFASLLQSIVRQPVPAGAPRAPGPGAGPFRVQFQNVPQAPTSNNSTANQTGPAGSHGTAPPRPQAPGPGSAVLSDEIFGQLVQGIGSHLSQAASGQQSTQTIADFLHNLGQGFNISAGEGMVSDLFMTVSQHLTFVDLMMVFFGNPQPLQALRTPLQQFLQDHVLHGNQPTVENIDQAVANILDDMRDEIAATAADVTPRDDIDFNMTLTRFIRQQLTITIRMIVNVPGDNQHFGRDLWERLRRVIHEFVVLSQHCLEGGTEAMERMVQSRLAVIASDVTPLTQQWMSSMTLQQLRQLLPSITIGSDDIMHYVVRHTAESSEPTQAANSSVSVSGVAQQHDNASQFNTEMANMSSQTEVMETEPQAAAVSTPAVEDEDTLGEDLEKEDEPRPPRPNIPRQVLDHLPPPPTKDSDEIAVVLGSEDWHRAVPSDWVPVITRDVRRQARQSHTVHQAGFSDAYIAGMPAKRRKMMSQESGEGMHSNDNSNSTNNSASNTSTR